MQPLEFAARLDPEFVTQRRTSLPVSIKSLALAIRTVQREHELGPGALPVRLGSDELT